MCKLARVRTLALALLLLVLLQLQPASVRGTEAVAEGTSTGETDRQWLSLLCSLRGGFGGYKNLTRGRAEDPSGPTKIGSYAGFLNPEFGLEAFGLGVSYDLNLIMSLSGTGVGEGKHDLQAGSASQRIKVVYALRCYKFHLLPEFGYVFLSEDASIYSPSDGPGRYREEYQDQNYCYGLSARARVIPAWEFRLWLYGRYVHDNLDIQVDNYRLELQLGNEWSAPPVPGEQGPEAKSEYLGLGVSWSKKTDGRSEWFVTLGFTVAVRLL
jgi:hypothetical protein